jgi:tetratricopeptide (TPR) repeat protein
MDELSHNDDLLIRYLDGELSPEERTALEGRLATDKTFREKLTNMQITVQAIKHLGTSQKVAGIHSQMMQELKPQQKTKLIGISKEVRYTMAVAASLLVLFIGVRIYMSSQPTSEKLYSQSFVDFNASGTRSNGNQLSEVEKHYQQKEYNAVINDTRSLHLDEKDSLLIGLAYLHTDKTANAIGFFQRIASSTNSFKEDGEFYLSLSYLKNKDYDKAITLMQKIADDTAHLYHKQFDKDFIENVKALQSK